MTEKNRHHDVAAKDTTSSLLVAQQVCMQVWDPTPLLCQKEWAQEQEQEQEQGVLDVKTRNIDKEAEHVHPLLR